MAAPPATVRERLLAVLDTMPPGGGQADVEAKCAVLRDLIRELQATNWLPRHAITYAHECLGAAAGAAAAADARTWLNRESGDHSDMAGKAVLAWLTRGRAHVARTMHAPAGAGAGGDGDAADGTDATLPGPQHPIGLEAKTCGHRAGNSWRVAWNPGAGDYAYVAVLWRPDAPSRMLLARMLDHVRAVVVWRKNELSASYMAAHEREFSLNLEKMNTVDVTSYTRRKRPGKANKIDALDCLHCIAVLEAPLHWTEPPATLVADLRAAFA